MDFKSGNGIAANYFLANSAKSTKYDDTLPDLGLEQGEVVPYSNHSKEKEIVYGNLTEQLFPKVFIMLTKSYNVVLYGLGSKRRFIEEFRLKLLENFTVIVFYGYKDVGPRQILTAFQEALDCDKTDEDYIIQRIQKLKKPIFLLIHSFDRLCVRNARIKPLINRILTTPKQQVHLLTSVDHVNSPLLWTCREVDSLNLVWVHCPTFDDYAVEKSFAHLSTSRSSGSANHRSATATLMAVSNVYENLPMNSQNIFLLILNFFQAHYSNGDAEQQSKSTGRRNNKAKKDEETGSDTEEEDEDESGRRTDFGGKSGKGFEGYPFSRLYLDCMDAFYVNSESTLRAQLVEFVDHKLIRSRTGSDGSEFIELLIQPKLIPKLLQELSH